MGAVFQQMSMVTISGDKAAFITCSYVVAVPLLEWAIPCIRSDSLSFKSWLAACFSLFGMYLLSGCAEKDNECSSTLTMLEGGEGLVSAYQHLKHSYFYTSYCMFAFSYLFFTGSIRHVFFCNSNYLFRSRGETL